MRFASVFTLLPAGGRTASSASASHRSLTLGFLLLAAACALPGIVAGQTPGTLDPAFTSAALGSNIFTVVDEIVDLKEEIVVGGDVDLFEGLYLGGQVNINFKGTDFGNTTRIVYTAVPQFVNNQADHDKTLVGGLFGSTPTDTGATGTGPAQNIQRLNSDGLLDVNFDPGSGADNFVTSILPEADGSIYVGGRFENFNKIEHEHVVRLNLDGSLDSAFSSKLNIEDDVLNIVNQLDPATGLPNGQIIIVGTFNRVDQTNTAKVARLNSDGSLDTTFNPAIGTRVLAAVVQSDGKIIIGGSFNSVNGTAVQNIARLNFDGSLDTTFKASVTTNPPLSPDETAVYTLYQLADGLIYVGGNFFTVNGERREYLARLLPDGGLDTTFDPGTAIINSVQSLAVQLNNRLLVGETVSRKINNIFPASLVRLYSNNPPLITIAAAKPNAAETGASGTPANGQFVLTRSGTSLNEPLTVYLTEGGTAIAGVDYDKLKVRLYSDTIVTKTFQPFNSTVTIGVRPKGDTLSSSPKTVTLTVQPLQGGGPDYILGSQTTATVEISQN